jgi:ubiquinone biosynthesis protein
MGKGPTRRARRWAETAVVGLLTFLAAAGFVVFWIAVLAVGARRLLALRTGPLRLLVSGVAGLAVAVVTVGERAQRPAFTVLFVGIGVLSAMGLLILGELVAPAGARPRPLQWYRAFRRWRQRTRRYAQLSRIAMRHGLGAYLAGRSGRRGATAHGRVELARRLRQALEEAGVVFVKFGQILSTRHDLLPAEFSDQLGRLQNEATPVGWAEIEPQLTAELGAPVGEVFAERR